jgi:signal recognition particle subunit SRP54
MFESLTTNLGAVLDKIKGRRLSEKDVDATLREIRLALLDADVNSGVVRSFTDSLKNKLVGSQISKALNPGQQIIKAVNDELCDLLGGQSFKLNYASPPPTVFMLVGLQGSGKTTTAAKLALYLKRQGRNPLLVAADLQRPAAVDQLKTLGESISVPVYSEPEDPVKTAFNGLSYAKKIGRDTVIIDTAGRLAIDEEMMRQARHIADATNPHYCFFTVDAMLGQDAAQVAYHFSEGLNLDAILVTKLDGDSRGGAILSVKKIVGKPIAFASTGEKLEDFDLFYPDRIASRILGMGDVLTLIEQAEQVFDEESKKRAEEALLSGKFTLDDFLNQMRQIRKMGPISNLLSMLPNVPNEFKNVDIPDSEISKIEAIISSMTPEERNNPSIIDSSRRMRIAKGSATSSTEVGQVVKNFFEAEKALSQMGFMGKVAVKKAKKVGKKNKTSGRYTPKKGR